VRKFLNGGDLHGSCTVCCGRGVLRAQETLEVKLLTTDKKIPAARFKSGRTVGVLHEPQKISSTKKSPPSVRRGKIFCWGNLTLHPVDGSVFTPTINQPTKLFR